MKKILLALLFCLSSVANASYPIPDFTSSTDGVTPASGGGTTNFLRADGTWVPPSGGGTPGGSSGQVQYNNSGVFGGLTSAQLTSDINNFTSSLPGAAPASGGGTTNFLRADGTWSAPAGGGVSLSTNNTWTADNIWGNGRPWVDVRAYGAVGDGTTDDSTAFSNAIAAMTSNYGSGTIYVPPSTNVYCVKSGVSITNSDRLVGSAIGNSVLSACGTDVTVVNLNGGHATLENIAIYGKGTNNDTGTFGSSNPAVSMGSNCVGCKISHVVALGGSNAFSLNGNDSLIIDSSGTTSFGSANAYITTGLWLIRDKFDLSTPATLPAAPISINAWAASHAYTVGTVVSTGGYNIQCTSPGTSAGSAPTLKNYGINFTDNTVTWQLLSPAAYYGVQIDTAASEVTASQIDISGFYTYGLGMTNTLSGTAPNQININQSIMGGAFFNEINAHDGHSLYLSNSEVGGCLSNNCQGIYFNTNWAGDVGIQNNLIVGSPTSIEIGAGTNTLIEGNRIFGGSNAAINTDPGITMFTISGNSLGTQSPWGANANAVRVNTGAADYYNITNNIIHGATTGITDNGSGTHKTLSGNN